jgi:uncharacterized membrane protein
MKYSITERIPRSLAKVITWRIIMIIQYFVIGFYTSGSIRFAAALAGFTTIINSTIYFLHERGWNKINWDREVKEENIDSTA